MEKPRFINTQIRGGIWEGELIDAGRDDPKITIAFQGVPLQGVVCVRDTQRDVWQVKAPIPAEMINDGLQTFTVSDESGNLLTSFSLLAGEALANDLRAKIDLLRSEVDILKKAFRKHCAEN